MSTELQKMRDFIASYPDFDILGQLQIDYTDKVPNSAGLFPGGLVEVSRDRDVLGNVEVVNQLNFALYALFEKAPDDDAIATLNAEWEIGFQQWVQAQSMQGNAPVFGDVPRRESITAQNGAIYSADEEGTAIYAIQLAVRYVKEF